MNLIETSAICISPNRQRREFDLVKLNELRDSIERLGLMHPIVLRQEGDLFYLVAGERRHRAITDLFDLGGDLYFNDKFIPKGYIPYTNLGDLNDIEREEAELEENTHRADLTWQEKASATDRLFALRTKQSTALSIPPPSIATIAEEIRGSGVGRAAEATRREAIVAQHLDKPEIAAAKTMDEAFKILKRSESLRRHSDHAKSVGAIFNTSLHKLHNMDAVEFLLQATDSTYDVILTDPPYGMGADKFGNAAGKIGGDHEYEDSLSNFEHLIGILARESIRITKPQAHLYLFCDLDQFNFLRGLFQSFGWEVHRTPLIWNKVHGSRVPWPECGPRRCYEFVLYAVKGKRPVTCIASDILTYPSDPNLGHAAQKPVALLSELLRRSCHAGDSVLDPFGGTGGIIEAAHEHKITSTYIERDPAYYGIALSRLETLEPV